jgi:hydroxypyruvate isomerase
MLEHTIYYLDCSKILTKGGFQMTFQLAVSAEMLFRDLPFVDRVARIHALGFQVEIWDWATKDLRALAATGAKFSSMTGYIRGDLLTPNGITELLATAEESLQAAAIIDCPRMNVHGTGLDSNGQAIIQRTDVTPGEWLTAVETLRSLAALGERYNRVFTLENLNTLVDHPGTPFAKAYETIALVAAVNSPYLMLNLDLYHAQIGEGNLVQLVRDALPYIGEIQVADVPGRCEPGTGEINYSRIGLELHNLGYTGVVGLEGWASGDSNLAVAAFKRIMLADIPA